MSHVTPQNKKEKGEQQCVVLYAMGLNFCRDIADGIITKKMQNMQNDVTSSQHLKGKGLWILQ